jgi:type II secretory pathway predicted ATPase ExeA
MMAPMHDASLAALETSPENMAPYLGGSRGRAVATLSRGLRDREILLLVTGAPGVGKSIVLCATLADLAGEPIRVIRLSNPKGLPWSRDDLAGEILGQPIKDPADLTVATIISELTAASGGDAQVIIAVDDAHTLTEDAMELLLLLASPARGSRMPPQLILAGRGEFWEHRRRGELQLITRLAERVTIEPLAGTDAREYIAFRLKQAGDSNKIIAAAALTEILRHSGGLPGRVDRILAVANQIRGCRGSRILTGDMVEAAAASLPEVPLSVPASAMTAMVHTSATAEPVLPPAGTRHGGGAQPDIGAGPRSENGHRPVHPFRCGVRGAPGSNGAAARSCRASGTHPGTTDSFLSRRGCGTACASRRVAAGGTDPPGFAAAAGSLAGGANRRAHASPRSRTVPGRAQASRGIVTNSAGQRVSAGIVACRAIGHRSTAC